MLYALRGGVGIDPAFAGSPTLARADGKLARMPTPVLVRSFGVVLECEQEDPRIDHTVLKCTRDDHVITIASAGVMHLYERLYVRACILSHDVLNFHVFV